MAKTFPDLVSRIKQAAFFQLLKQAALEWYADNTFMMGAALAYYAVFSIAPILVIAVAIASLVFGKEAAEGQIVRELEQTVGPTLAQAIQSILGHAYTSGSGKLATAVSLVLLLLATTGVFSQLQESLNAIWKVKPKAGRGVWGVFRDRFWSFLTVIVVGLLLLAALCVNAGLYSLSQLLNPAQVPGGTFLWQIINLVVFFVLVTVLFGFIFRVLPDVKITWKEVSTGAALTALLFIVGNHVIGLYLARASTTSAYGAAGSLVVILLWVYYCSQILLFGAEFTQVYAKRGVRRVQPARHAMAVIAPEADCIVSRDQSVLPSGR
jgi:membrane protein